MIAGFTIIGLILLSFLKKYLSMDLPPFILPHTGNMGIPICLFAYGTQGWGVASAVAAVIRLFHCTWGAFLATKRCSFAIVLKSPTVYEIISAVILLFEIETPLVLENTTFILTYATIFLVLMSLGIALTRFKFSLKDSVILYLCRVVFGRLGALILI